MSTSTISREFVWSKEEREILRKEFRTIPGLNSGRIVRNYRDRRQILGSFWIDQDVIEDGPRGHPLDLDLR